MIATAAVSSSAGASASETVGSTVLRSRDPFIEDGPMIRALRVFLLLWVVPAAGQAQETSFVPGYRERVRGEVLSYHSPLPGVDHALLVRAQDAARYIEWETAPVPEDWKGEWVSFVWLFGLQADADQRRFELRIDGEPWFELRNPLTTATRDWTLSGPSGSELRFRATLVDRFDDLMGFATLRLPVSACTPGRPLRIAVVGESAGSRSWYMTFQESVREAARLSFPPAVLRGVGEAGKARQIVRLDVIHLGEPVEATVASSFDQELRHTLQLGSNSIELLHPRLAQPEDVRVELRVAGRAPRELTGRMEVVRPWHVDLVQHTHTDVGYTRPQTEILPEHLRYIDTALDYCERTDSYPDDARFRWTCETSWAVREYLESRTPEQVARLRERVEQGRIEVTGMFLNMSEVVDEASYASFLRPIRFLRSQGLPVRTAMHNDINGAPWCLADYAGEIGIDFLTMGQHGHRARVPFEQPTCFWWESPAGNRVLAYRADHYQTGNFWGVHTGNLETVEAELFRYLQHLERSEYPFDRVAVQHSGYPTDNSPPSTAASELVRRWNEKYLHPRLRCSTAGEFPAFVREHHGDRIRTVRAAWPDWWTDGFGSAPRESAAARVTQARLAAVESLLAAELALGLEVPAPLAREIAEIRDALLFYGEHTFGAAESITEPFSENTVVQWAEKSAYAWDAVKRAAVLGEGALGRLADRISSTDTPQLVVFNGLGFARSGLLELYVDHELLPVDRPFHLVTDDGEELPVQLLGSREDGSYWAIWVQDVPCFGLRGWRVLVDETGKPAPRAKPAAGLMLESAHYRLQVDPETGGLESLYDKELELELVDGDAAWQLGQLVHETLGNREQMEGFRLDDYERHAASEVVAEGVVRGPIWDALHVRAELPGCARPGGLRWEYRLHHGAKLVELHYTVQKRRVFDPESMYVAFPFRMPDGKVAYETLGGIVRSELDILPGASSDWQVMQNFASVSGAAGQIVLTSDEVALIQVGAINTGKFQRRARVERPHLYSWVMNNYWTTNFVAAPEGELRWSYELTSGAERGTVFASRFGQSSRIPFLARLLPAGDEPGRLQERSILPLESENLLLVAARPDPDDGGILLHLREVAGQPGSLPSRAWTAPGVRGGQLQNAIGDVLGELGETETFRPFQTKFLKLRIERGR